MSLAENSKLTQLFDPAVPSVGANTSAALLRDGGNVDVMLIFNYGSWSTTTASFAVEVQHSDAAGSGFAAVPDAQLDRAESEAGVAAAATVGDDQVKKIGYIGEKPYVRAVVTHVGGVGATGVLGVTAAEVPRKGPAA